MLKEELRRKSLRDKIDDLSEDQAHFVLLSVFYGGDKSRYISEDPNRYASKCKEELLKRTRKDDKIDTVISFIDNLNTLYLEKYELKWLEGNERAQIFVYNYLVENNMISPSRFGISRKKDIKDIVHNILNKLSNTGDFLWGTRYFILTYCKCVFLQSLTVGYPLNFSF